MDSIPNKIQLYPISEETLQDSSIISNNESTQQRPEDRQTSQLPFPLDTILTPQSQETQVNKSLSNKTLNQIGADIKNLFLKIIGQNSYPSVRVKGNKLQITSFYVPFNSSFKYVAEITIDETHESISMCYWLCRDNGQAFKITSQAQRILISKSLNSINQTFNSGFFSIDIQGSIQLKKSTLLSPLKFKEFTWDFYECENQNENRSNHGSSAPNSSKMKNKLLEYIQTNLVGQVKQLQVATAVILYMCDELQGEYFDILQDQGIIGNYDAYQRLQNRKKDLFDLVYSNQLFQKSVNNIEIFKQPYREPEPTLSSKIFQEIHVEEVNNIGQSGTGGFGEIQMANVKYVGKVRANNSDPHKKGDEKVCFQKIFAIKKNIAASKLNKNLDDRNRVTHELEILRLLQDLEFPHVARYFFSMQDEYKEFLFIDYYQFKDLNTFSNNFSKTLSLHSKLNFMLQFSLGLKFLNDRGFYHLDIKPQNLLIGKDYILKIADFGESFHSDALEDKFNCNWDKHFQEVNEDHLQSFWREKHRVNSTLQQIDDSLQKPKFRPARTIPFCPPECLSEELKISFQSDIFSLGVMLSEILFDTFPFVYLKSRPELLQRQFFNQSWEAFLPEEYVVGEKGPKVVIQALLHLALSCLKPSILLPKPKQESASEGNYILDRPSIDKIIEILSLCKEYLFAHYSLSIPQIL